MPKTKKKKRELPPLTQAELSPGDGAHEEGDDPMIPERTATKYDKTPGSLGHVTATLLAAGFKPGRHTRPGLPASDADVPGFVVDTRFDWSAPTPELQAVRHVFVEHIGRRRTEALRRYARALKAARLAVYAGIKEHHGRVAVLWIGRPIKYRPYRAPTRRGRARRAPARQRPASTNLEANVRAVLRRAAGDSMSAAAVVDALPAAVTAPFAGWDRARSAVGLTLTRMVRHGEIVVQDGAYRLPGGAEAEVGA